MSDNKKNIWKFKFYLNDFQGIANKRFINQSDTIDIERMLDVKLVEENDREIKNLKNADINDFLKQISKGKKE